MVALTAFKGRRIAVVGLGKSGRAVAEALAGGGAKVTAYDDKAEARAAGINGVTTVDSLEAIDWPQQQALVLSPGIPLTHPQPHPAAQKARAAGCPIIGDVELLYRQHPKQDYVGITGTNGKSTTTALIAHLLRTGGRPAEEGGNLGVAATALPEPKKKTVYVLEMSSYQLDLTDRFHCRVAVYLNISPDHLDRHGGTAGYIAAKERIFRHMEGGDVAVLGWDDPHTRAVLLRHLKQGGKRVIGIGMASKKPAEVKEWIAYTGSDLAARLAEGEHHFSLEKAPSLQGPHNAQNACAAIAAALAESIAPAKIQKGLESYVGLPHRMEEVGRIGKVRYVNDSKATNADSAHQALKSYHNIYWIAGGKPKEGDVLDMTLIKERVTKTYLVGMAQEQFAKLLEGVVPFERCDVLEKALNRAHEDAQAKGEGIVLLSPACASWDQWPSFEVRGDAFRTQVQRLTGNKTSAIGDAPIKDNGAARAGR